MDISKITHGAKLVLGGTILFLIVSFFSWFSIAGNGFANMWHGIGVLAGLLAIVLLAWEAVHLYGIKVGLPLHPAMTGAVLAVLVLVFAFIRFIATPGGDLGAAAGVGRTFWAWLGLFLAILIVVGAVANMKAIGLTMADVKEQASAAAASAGAAAKSATDKGDDAPAAAPAAPAAPAARCTCTRTDSHGARPSACRRGRGTGSRRSCRRDAGAGRSPCRARSGHGRCRRRDAAADAGLSPPGPPAPARAGAGTPLHWAYD